MAPRPSRPRHSERLGGSRNGGGRAVPTQVIKSQQNHPGSGSIEQGGGGTTEIQPSWRSLFAFTTRTHSLSILFSGAASILAGVLKPIASIFFGKIFSILADFGGGTLDAKDTLHGIAIWCVALTALGVAAWIFEGLFISAWIVFGEQQAKSVREKMFVGLLEKELEWYDLRADGIGSLMTRIQT